MSELMEDEVYNAAIVGDVTIFNDKKEEQLLRKTSQNNNIIHIAAKQEQIHFIQAALDSLPQTPTCESLICDQNRHGNTPLHIVAEAGDEAVVHRLCEFFPTQCRSDMVVPWRVMNKDGNTPAHIALLYGNVSVAMYLVEKDSFLARIMNHSKETLLHLAVHRVFETQGPRSYIWPIIELLLKIDSSVACWEDANGATPVHRATSLNPVYCIPFIKAVLASCPKAAEVYEEGSGQTILHRLTNHHVASYKEGIELLNNRQLYAFRNIKDNQGDTPLHLAARNGDSNMVQVLLASSAKLDIKNKSGVSAGTLVRQLEGMRFKETRTEERTKLTESEYIAAKQGNIAFLNENLVSWGTNLLVSRTPKGGNILHILMQCKFDEDAINETEEFIGQAIQKVPLLICQKDCNGNTPIHVLAENDYYIVRLLGLCRSYFNKVLFDDGDGLYTPPWTLKNLKGDTPLHVAVRAGHFRAADLLLTFDNEVAGYVNNRLQTPLHILASCHGFHENMIRDMDMLRVWLIYANAELPYMQDKDGLTPLLTAAQNLHFPMFRELCLQFPDCADITDYKGRTMWHLLVNQSLDHDASLSFITSLDQEASFSFTKVLTSEIPLPCEVALFIRPTTRSKDNDGNTPLHLAIVNQHFSVAQSFLKDEDERDWKEILEIKNNAGFSCYDLIGSAAHFPYEFEKFLTEKKNHLLGHRSLYGVPTTKIGEYANTIGVIAALLATITFTAAFTVPGGLDSSNGAPLLLQKAIFKMFMVADMVALYSSVMVLFCLLWIMTTACKKDTILLLDVSVFLLQTSFLATLVTFMTGLYVTTISTSPSIAISSCVTCTLLIILMRKKLVMLTVVPTCTTLIIWGKVLGRSLSNLWSLIKNKLQDWLYKLFCFIEYI